MELLLGCGNHREKVIVLPNAPAAWTHLVTLDNDPDCGADIEHDLERLPYPFPADHFDECHAYHVLEHQGGQGDYRFFFDQFSEFWRILKPGGLFCGIVPSLNSEWAWGDPGHKRVLPQPIFTFLDQSEYTKQVGVTAFADYRRFWRADFEPVAYQNIDRDQFAFVLRAVKPSRISR
jgi:SAM-dependent methyltransferase